VVVKEENHKEIILLKKSSVADGEEVGSDTYKLDSVGLP